jgi:hypothetical protein
MTEQISHQSIIAGLEELELSFLDKLLTGEKLTLEGVSSLIKNPAYMAAYQRVKNSDQLDHQPSSKDKQITSLYHRITQMADAIPAIQDMQDVEEEWGISIAAAAFKNLPPTTQEAVLQTLQHLRDCSNCSRLDEKLDLASQAQAPEGQEAEDQGFLDIARDIQDRVNDLVKLLNAISPPSEREDSGSDSFLARSNDRTQ